MELSTCKFLLQICLNLVPRFIAYQIFKGKLWQTTPWSPWLFVCQTLPALKEVPPLHLNSIPPIHLNKTRRSASRELTNGLEAPGTKVLYEYLLQLIRIHYKFPQKATGKENPIKCRQINNKHLLGVLFLMLLL